MRENKWFAMPFVWVLAKEIQAVPLSRSEHGSGHEEICEVKKQPPSEARRKEKEREKRNEQQKVEKKERKRIKAEAAKVDSSGEEDPIPYQK